jgi:hypothetical protein
VGSVEPDCNGEGDSLQLSAPPPPPEGDGEKVGGATE